METSSLCQWCARWKKDTNSRMGTCDVLRKIKVVAQKRRGNAAIMRTLTTRIATHADDGCAKHFVEKAGVFSAVTFSANPSLSAS